jgi:hypothetical protein
VNSVNSSHNNYNNRLKRGFRDQHDNERLAASGRRIRQTIHEQVNETDKQRRKRTREFAANVLGLDYFGTEVKFLREYPRGERIYWVYSEPFIACLLPGQSEHQKQSRRLLHLYFRTRVPVSDIAAELGLSQKAVQCRVARLTKKAEAMVKRKNLEAYYFDAPLAATKAGRILVTAGQVVTAQPYDLYRLLKLSDAEDSNYSIRNQAQAALNSLDAVPELLAA